MGVKGIGPVPCDFFIVGESPGLEEMKAGVPFAPRGATGREMRRLFDGDSLPPFEETFRTNVYREYKGKDAIYDASDFERDEPELLDELRQCNPQVVVTVGRHATRYFLGDVGMDEVHGLPWFLPRDSKYGSLVEEQQRALANRGRPENNDRGIVVFPCFHPAAGFRSPEASALVSYDFAQLALFVAGSLTPRILHDDPIPHPQYKHVTQCSVIDTFKAVTPTRNLAVDTEGWTRKPYSVQWSWNPGTGYMALAKDTEIVNAFLTWLVAQRTKITFHSSLHDRAMLRALARECGWDDHKILFELDTLPFDDTMVMAYLLQLEPQGLKGLATRHANMAMQSYDEVIGDAQNRLALDHLVSMWDCLNFDYEEEQRVAFTIINATPLTDQYGEPKRSKDGQIKLRKTTVLPKPPKSGLFKAVERCLKAKHPYKLYHDQTEDICDAGYRLLGEMPEASLSHVEFSTALAYGCRDADATTRIETEMESRVKAMGLHEVYELELGTYPLIDRMMVVGMRPNLKIFEELSRKLEFEIADIQVRLEQHTAREGFNANSGDQVSDFLFGKLNLPPIKLTNGGDRWSTNDKILEALEKEHGHEFPVVSDIRSYREVYKLKNTFCVAPWTRILTRGLRWTQAGNLKTGDQLLAFDEEPTGANGQYRSWRSSDVLTTRRLRKQCYRLTFNDGTVVICSHDHRWLARKGSQGKAEWIRTDQLLATDHAAQAKHDYSIIKPLRVWDERPSYEDGWLAGIFDGEGCLIPHKGRTQLRLCVSQNKGTVLDTIEREYRRRGFAPSRTVTDTGNVKLNIGKQDHIFELLGRCRPVRLLQKFASCVELPSITLSSMVKIVHREDIGEQEVVALETSTHTFIAEGLASHNCDRVPDFVHRYPYDGRVHATFRTTRVITGRLAASDPNVLAQPEHGKFAKDFKAGWEAEPGHVVCNWDLSQVELRVLAHLSRDPVLCQAYTFECSHPTDWQPGKTVCKRDPCVLKGDLHAVLAHQTFGLQPSQQDDSKHRLPAKSMNFGLAMGMTCHGLMIELRKNGVEVDEDGAQEWIDASNALYKKVPHYKDEKIAEARRNGLIRCLSGRIRYIGGIRSRDRRLCAEAERFAFSTPIQEGAQMLMKQAEAYIWNELLMKHYYRDGWFKGGSKGRWVEPLVQVHDALKFEVAKGQEQNLHVQMCHAMTKIPTQLLVPLGVEGKFGKSFATMEKFR